MIEDQQIKTNGRIIATMRQIKIQRDKNYVNKNDRRLANKNK